MMLYKLLKHDINGSIYKIIKSLYSTTGYNVKIGDDISPMFYGQNGLKQGCCLSPTLSSIFQNDLHDIFDFNSSDPIQLGSIMLNSISFADDLLCISLSREGLQNCLNKLESYCRKWGLEINENKTKCMVMSKRKGPFQPICIQNTPIEYVTCISYLGFNFNRNGSVDSMIQDRILKSSRVCHMLLQAISTNKNISSKLAIELFDKQIVPILLYGCPIWAIPTTHNLIYLDNQPENTSTREIVNNFLSSVLNRVIPIEYCRRVGRRTDDGTHRKILIKLKYFSDKCELLRTSRGSNTLSKFNEKEHIIEKVQHDFCKKNL